MTYCVILHNMIVEDEGDGAARTHDFEKSREHVHLPEEEVEYVMHFLEMHQQLIDELVHTQLFNDLVEHMYVFMGKQ